MLWTLDRCNLHISLAVSVSQWCAVGFSRRVDRKALQLLHALTSSDDLHALTMSYSIHSARSRYSRGSQRSQRSAVWEPRASIHAALDQVRPVVPLDAHAHCLFYHQISINERLQRVITQSHGSGQVPDILSGRFSLRSAQSNGVEGGKVRPCVMMPNDDVVPLTTLEGFPPYLLSCYHQDFLVSINDTPGWPTVDAFKVRIEPSWPRRTDSSRNHYALGVLCRVKDVDRFGERLAYVGPDNISKPYYAENGFILHWECLNIHSIHQAKVRERAHRMYYDHTVKTSHDLFTALHRYAEDAQGEKRDFTDDECRRIEQLGNDHIAAVRIAQGSFFVKLAIPAFSPTSLPVQFRRFFPGHGFIPPPYHSAYPSVDLPDEVASRCFDTFRPFVSSMDDSVKDEYVLAEILLKIIETTGAQLPDRVRTDFLMATSANVLSMVRNDALLAAALREITDPWTNGFRAIERRLGQIRNYICATSS
ncbi:hypothetical protein EXIGLDRAFT_837216 [Exidia glandulosa HHB12029]|uniref:Uncharacterized protein n=1 Tax=Exidia glandulosa HHB12029 TaxID=1314781 RepID=A0A165H018_EXIGL|nr:hypothetical protein EXIGLDRAFT_837216 [Exidia glandulosa HHB12029]